MDDDEQTEGAGGAVRSLAVELGEGEGPGIVEERVEIVDCVEDGNYVEEGSDEADDVLREDGFGDIDTWFGDFFCKVGDAVTGSYQYSSELSVERYLRCANSVRSVQHTSTKDKSIAGPAGLVLPFFPHKRLTCVALASSRGHNSTHHNSHEAASQDQKQTHIGEGGQGAVGIHDEEASHPGIDEVHDEDVPPFIGIVRVEETVHADDLVGKNRSHGCGAKEPAKEVPPGGER
jgi:hypothetical protein